MADIPITVAIQQLRDQLREAIIEARDKEIVFTPNEIELELSVTFKAEGEGTVKLLALLDLSARASRESLHKIRLSLSVADRNGHPIKVRDESRQLPQADTSQR